MVNVDIGVTFHLLHVSCILRVRCTQFHTCYSPLGRFCCSQFRQVPFKPLDLSYIETLASDSITSQSGIVSIPTVIILLVLQALQLQP
jgi:hypothetical protein